MLKLKITRSTMEFKQMIKSISNISKYSSIEFSQNSTLFNTRHKETNILSILHLAPNFFAQYLIPRDIFLSFNVLELHDFLDNNADDDDDDIHFYSEGQVPITNLDVCSHNIGLKKIKIKTLEVTELYAIPWTYEPVHEFKVAINSELFKKVSLISALSKKPIHVTIAGPNIRVTSGHQVFHKDLKQANDEFIIKDAPESMYYELQLPSGLARSFYRASHIATVVNIRDSYCSNIYRPILLEFSFSPVSRLLFYFSEPFLRV